jgi:hypothetical protein
MGKKNGKEGGSREGTAGHKTESLRGKMREEKQSEVKIN